MISLAANSVRAAEICVLGPEVVALKDVEAALKIGFGACFISLPRTIIIGRRGGYAVLVEVPKPESTVRTESAYGPTYRFRLWAAAVEDSITLERRPT